MSSYRRMAGPLLPVGAPRSRGRERPVRRRSRKDRGSIPRGTARPLPAARGDRRQSGAGRRAWGPPRWYPSPRSEHGTRGTRTTVTTTSILLLSAVAEAAEPLAAALRAAGHEVTTLADADEAIRRAGEFTLVTIDAVAPPRSGTEVCAEIRRTPSLTAIPVLCVSQKDDVEERVRFLEAGADDVIARPFDPRELEARVEGLLIRFRRSRDHRAPDGRRDPAGRPPAPDRVLQPQGGRRDHHDRGQRRDGPGGAGARPGRRSSISTSTSARWPRTST